MKLRNVIFMLLIFVVILQFMGMRKHNSEPAPIYNKIANKELIAIIEDFIERGKGTKMDEKCKFLKIRTWPLSNKKTYQVFIRYMGAGEHIGFYKHPTIICAPIGGKKIYIDQCRFSDPFIWQNRPDVGKYFREDYPDMYRCFLESVKEDSKRADNMGPDLWLYDARGLSARFDQFGKFIDSTYDLYDAIN